MGLEKERSNIGSIACLQGMLGNDLHRAFERTLEALQDRNESIARVTRSLDELVDVLDEAILTFSKSAPIDRAS